VKPVCRCKAYLFPHRKDGGKCTERTRDVYRIAHYPPAFVIVNGALRDAYK
jgi:hypothetical protein